MRIDPEHIPQLTVLLSAERLAKLNALTGSAQASIELHQATLRLGASLMHVLATVEIALRNATAQNLGAHFGVANWLQQPPAGFRWKEPERKKVAAAVDSARRSEFAKLDQAGKAALDGLAYPRGRPSRLSPLQRAKDRRKFIAITEGKVIAELTLYFWKRLYGPDYDHHLWQTTLKRNFPNRSISRAHVSSQLENIYQARNRLAHHEPVLYQRFSDTISAIEFVIQTLNSTTPSPHTALANLLTGDLANVRKEEAALRDKIDQYRL